MFEEEKKKHEYLLKKHEYLFWAYQRIPWESDFREHLSMYKPRLMGTRVCVCVCVCAGVV